MQKNRRVAADEALDFRKMLADTLVEIDVTHGYLLEPKAFVGPADEGGAPKYFVNPRVDFAVIAKTNRFALSQLSEGQKPGALGERGEMKFIYKTPDGISLVGTDPVPDADGQGWTHQ